MIGNEFDASRDRLEFLARHLAERGRAAGSRGALTASAARVDRSELAGVLTGLIHAGMRLGVTDYSTTVHAAGLNLSSTTAVAWLRLAADGAVRPTGRPGEWRSRWSR